MFAIKFVKLIIVPAVKLRKSLKLMQKLSIANPRSSSAASGFLPPVALFTACGKLVDKLVINCPSQQLPKQVENGPAID